MKPNKPEKKDISPVVATTTNPVAREFNASAVLISGCAQGVGNSQRIGRQITFKSLEFTVTQLYPGATPVQDLAATRLVVFYDRQPAVASPAILSVFNTNDYQSYRTLSGQDRFIILIDDYIGMDHTGPDSYNVTKTYYRKLNLPCIFNGTGSGAADITTGAIQYYVGGPRIMSWNVTSRIRYIDA